MNGSTEVEEVKNWGKGEQRLKTKEKLERRPAREEGVKRPVMSTTATLHIFYNTTNFGSENFTINPCFIIS